MELSESPKRDVEKDASHIYIGNLETVEVDLELPSRGQSGSSIFWESSNTQWIENNGKVHRPEYGRGDREVILTAKVVKEGAMATRQFAARVLQKASKIEISLVYPINITVKQGKNFYLPMFVSAKTCDGRVLSLRVNWEGGVEHEANFRGQMTYYGFMEDGNVNIQANVASSRNGPFPPISTKPSVKCLGLEHVRLTGQGFLALNQRRRIEYLHNVDDDQLLFEFRKTAGLDTRGATEMLGWDSSESQLRGHTTGHNLSAYALAYGATGDEKVLEKLNYVVGGLKEVQDALLSNDKCHFGFLSAYDETQFDELERFIPYPTIWAPYYTLHKIIAGLLDAHRYAFSNVALDVAAKVGEWVYNRLSKLPHEQLQNMWSMYIAGEFGGMNEVLAKLFERTHNQKHLEAATLFNNDRLMYPMQQHIDALGGLHANQHIPQVVGSVQLFKSTGLPIYLEQAKMFWESVVTHHTYAMGGTGKGEMFEQPDMIGSLLDNNTAESCATYNMLKLTASLSEYYQDAKHGEYYENATINHIACTSDHLPNGGSIYFLPTSPNGRKEFDTENSCCHGSGLESHFYYALGANYVDEYSLYIKLYLNCRIYDREEGIDIEEVVEDSSPEKVTIHIKRLNRQELHFRCPGWSRAMAEISLSGNGIASRHMVADKDEIVLSKKHLKNAGASNWEGITVELRFHPHIYVSRTLDKPEIAAIFWGPYLLAALSDGSQLLELYIDDRDPDQAFERKVASNTFTHKSSGVKFVPLWQINEQPYCIYVRILISA